MPMCRARPWSCWTRSRWGSPPKIVDEIFDHLQSLRPTGAALLLVEQYVERALELADFVYILEPRSRAVRR